MKSMLQSLDDMRCELKRIKHKDRKKVKEIIKDCKEFKNTPSDIEKYHTILAKYRTLNIVQEIDWSTAFNI